jgi:hypothetical protein
MKQNLPASSFHPSVGNVVAAKTYNTHSPTTTSHLFLLTWFTWSVSFISSVSRKQCQLTYLLNIFTSNNVCRVNHPTLLLTTFSSLSSPLPPTHPHSYPALPHSVPHQSISTTIHIGPPKVLPHSFLHEFLLFLIVLQRVPPLHRHPAAVESEDQRSGKHKEQACEHLHVELLRIREDHRENENKTRPHRTQRTLHSGHLISDLALDLDLL